MNEGERGCEIAPESLKVELKGKVSEKSSAIAKCKTIAVILEEGKIKKQN